MTLGQSQDPQPCPQQLSESVLAIRAPEPDPNPKAASKTRLEQRKQLAVHVGRLAVRARVRGARDHHHADQARVGVRLLVHRRAVQERARAVERLAVGRGLRQGRVR